MVNRLRRNLLIGVPVALALRPWAAASAAPLGSAGEGGIVQFWACRETASGAA